MNYFGFQMLFSCYEVGVSRLQSLLRQDVLKTEKRCVKGRRAKNIIAHKLENLVDESLVKRKREYQFLTNEANERVTKRPRIETSQPPEIKTATASRN